MKFLVIGCGSIGERHIQNLLLLKAGTIFVCDTDINRLTSIKKKYSTGIFTDVDMALNQNPDAVLICTPPSLHISLGCKALHNGAHVFMEKPLSHTMKNVDDFIRLANKKKLKVFVGYNLRFHPGIQLMKQLLDGQKIGRILSAHAEVGQYLPDWHPSQDYKKSYTAQRKFGGGIILDASHEIDYIMWLLGDINQVSCFAGKLSSLHVDVEDTAEILLRFKTGIIGHIHLDFIQRQYSRNCKIIGEEGTIWWDYAEKFVKIYSAEPKQTTTSSLSVEHNHMYVEEMKHFLSCITGETEPLITGEQGKQVLRIALAAKKSASTGKMIQL